MEKSKFNDICDKIAIASITLIIAIIAISLIACLIKWGL